MTEQDETRWLDQAEQRAWRAYVVGTTLLMDRLDHDLRDQHDLGLPEYEILVRLSESPGHRMRMALLADSLCHSRSRVTHTVTRMGKRDLVVREECSDDGRGVEAVMTPHGQAVLTAAAPTHVAGVRALMVDLAEGDDFAALGRVFDRVADKLIVAHPAADIR